MRSLISSNGRDFSEPGNQIWSLLSSPLGISPQGTQVQIGSHRCSELSREWFGFLRSLNMSNEFQVWFDSPSIPTMPRVFIFVILRPKYVHWLPVARTISSYWRWSGIWHEFGHTSLGKCDFMSLLTRSNEAGVFDAIFSPYPQREHPLWFSLSNDSALWYQWIDSLLPVTAGSQVTTKSRSIGGFDSSSPFSFWNGFSIMRIE